MNKRIRELANKAGYHPDVFEMCKPGMEKFAELIVLECASVNYNSPFQDGEFHAREVLEHFGVEE